MGPFPSKQEFERRRKRAAQTIPARFTSEDLKPYFKDADSWNDKTKSALYIALNRLNIPKEVGFIIEQCLKIPLNGPSSIR